MFWKEPICCEGNDCIDEDKSASIGVLSIDSNLKINVDVSSDMAAPYEYCLLCKTTGESISFSNQQVLVTNNLEADCFSYSSIINAPVD